ncbi:G-type lectin S-receptor-like serine/threonine-protein kinase SD2-2 [Cryptomeria japonica]|uniref:G-type lectin S-receptor-like serine/threonine-protein kinase SD2-2 n=1 Tax=Cryptomeria japonica TaxID=3369 RepID=UPI0027DA15D5|nr:G-type lectin S-receptor-like serine/threonine-protein kinase SD2-2 [Cryptomeria japonica]
MGKLFQSLFFAVNVFIQLKSNGDAMEAGDTLLLGASLTGNQTIISKNGTFELGFFTPNGSNWYIGIWYAQIPQKTYVWVANSFDKPVDTLLLGMTFGGRQKLVSWKNSFDPTLGFFSLHMDPSGSKQFVLTWNNPIQYWESGTWDGKIYIGVPESEDKHYFYMSVEINSTGLFHIYTLNPQFSALTRCVVPINNRVAL